MSATELMEFLEQAQREGLGEEPLEVTAEQVDRLGALIERQEASVRNTTAIPMTGRLLFVRG